MKKYIGIIGALVIVFFIGVGFYRTTPVNASTPVGGEYTATSTGQGSRGISNFSPIQTFSGTLGSVVITAVGTDPIFVYDASTTDATMRGNIATTSLPLIAFFPASEPVGTYTFDAKFVNGLVIVQVGTVANQASTTITWR